MVEGSFQSSEALPIEHLQIIFVASFSCSEDDASTSTTASITACQQRPETLANGNVSLAQPKEQDVKPKSRRASAKNSPFKKVLLNTREGTNKGECERKMREEEELLDAPLDGWPLRRVISIEEDHLPHLLQGGPQPLLHQLNEEDQDDIEAQSDTEFSIAPPLGHNTVFTEAPLKEKSLLKQKQTQVSPRGQPVGKETQSVSQLHSIR